MKTTSAAAEYEAMFWELDRLWQEGKGESDEAEAIRDRSDPIWEQLTDEEQQRIHDLSRSRSHVTAA